MVNDNTIEELKIEEGDQSRNQASNHQQLKIKWIMEESSIAIEDSRLKTFQELGSLRRGVN